MTVATSVASHHDGAASSQRHAPARSHHAQAAAEPHAHTNGPQNSSSKGTGTASGAASNSNQPHYRIGKDATTQNGNAIESIDSMNSSGALTGIPNISSLMSTDSIGKMSSSSDNHRSYSGIVVRSAADAHRIHQHHKNIDAVATTHASIDDPESDPQKARALLAQIGITPPIHEHQDASHAESSSSRQSETGRPSLFNLVRMIKDTPDAAAKLSAMTAAGSTVHESINEESADASTSAQEEQVPEPQKEESTHLLLDSSAEKSKQTATDTEIMFLGLDDSTSGTKKKQDLDQDKLQHSQHGLRRKSMMGSKHNTKENKDVESDDDGSNHVLNSSGHDSSVGRSSKERNSNISRRRSVVQRSSVSNTRNTPTVVAHEDKDGAVASSKRFRVSVGHARTSVTSRNDNVSDAVPIDEDDDVAEPLMSVTAAKHVHVLANIERAESVIIKGLPPEGNSHVPSEHVYRPEDLHDMFLDHRPSAVLVTGTETDELLRELSHTKAVTDATEVGEDAENMNDGQNGRRSRRGRADTRSPLANSTVVARKYTPCRKPRSHLPSSSTKKAPPLPPSPPEVRPPVPPSPVAHVAPERLLRSLLRVHEMEAHPREDMSFGKHQQHTPAPYHVGVYGLPIGFSSNSNGDLSRQSSISALIPKEGPYYVHPWIQETPRSPVPRPKTHSHHHHGHVDGSQLMDTTLPDPVPQHPDGRRWLLEHMAAGSAMSLSEFQKVLDNTDFNHLAHALVPLTRYIPSIGYDLYSHQNIDTSNTKFRRGSNNKHSKEDMMMHNQHEVVYRSVQSREDRRAALREMAARRGAAEQLAGRLTPAGFVGTIQYTRSGIPFDGQSPQNRFKRKPGAPTTASIAAAAAAVVAAENYSGLSHALNQRALDAQSNTLQVQSLSKTQLHDQQPAIQATDNPFPPTQKVSLTDLYRMDTGLSQIFSNLSNQPSSVSMGDQAILNSLDSGDHQTQSQAPATDTNKMPALASPNETVQKQFTRLAIRLPALPIHVPTLPPSRAATTSTLSMFGGCHRKIVPNFHEERLFRVMHHEYPDIRMNEKPVSKPSVKLAIIGQKSESLPDIAIVYPKSPLKQKQDGRIQPQLPALASTVSLLSSSTSSLHVDRTASHKQSVSRLHTTNRGAGANRLPMPKISVRGYQPEPDDKMTKMIKIQRKAENLRKSLKTTGLR